MCTPGNLDESYCRPCIRHASRGSETPSLRRRIDGHDRILYHLSCPGAGLQPGANRGFALSTIAAVGCPAAFAVSSAGRHCRGAPGAHGVGAVDRDYCRTVPEMKIAENKKDEFEGHDGFPLKSGHSQCSGQTNVQICQTCAVLSHPHLAREEAPGWHYSVPRRRSGGPLAWSLLRFGLPRLRDIAVPVSVPWRQGAWAR